MESFFIRHTYGMGVVEEAIDYLWKNDKIAIHFPEVEDSTPKEIPDKTSISSDDYQDRAHREAISTFSYLNLHGGYIWAEYRNRNEVKVGKIVPNSFKIFDTKWAAGEFPYERTAKLKTLQIDKESVRIVHMHEAMSLRAARPRQGTIKRWHTAQNRLMALVEGTSAEKSWGGLSPAEQETACSEYLRNPDVSDCPVLKHLLLPVGRTLKDVDIFGYATDKKTIFAQVTYGTKEESATKIKDLKAYASPDSRLIFFCDCDKPVFENGIMFIPWKQVESWIRKDGFYLERLFKA